MAAVDAIITCHNYGRFLRDDRGGMLAQIYPSASAVVVDASSTDETAAVAAGYADRGVRYTTGRRWRRCCATPARGDLRAAGRLLDADDALAAPPDRRRREASSSATRRRRSSPGHASRDEAMRPSSIVHALREFACGRPRRAACTTSRPNPSSVLIRAPREAPQGRRAPGLGLGQPG